MQTHTAIIEKNSRFIQNNPSGGAIGHLITRLFGCWHKEMSRPFSSQGQTYRSCLRCGARRQFNLGRWEMQGRFYYRRPSTTTYFRPLSSVSAR
ncbi:MAG TPA: hypothetical protein VIF64_23155 [Pyrinomonadaceae bacterium]